MLGGVGRGEKCLDEWVKQCVLCSIYLAKVVLGLSDVDRVEESLWRSSTHQADPLARHKCNPAPAGRGEVLLSSAGKGGTWFGNRLGWRRCPNIQLELSWMCKDKGGHKYFRRKRGWYKGVALAFNRERGKGTSWSCSFSDSEGPLE